MIEVSNISFKYGGSLNRLLRRMGVTRHKSEPIFEDFSLTLKENNIYGLLGKNGTGKSTLLYLISGLLHPQQGTVIFDGVETRLRRPEILREMFIVPKSSTCRRCRSTPMYVLTAASIPASTAKCSTTASATSTCPCRSTSASCLWDRKRKCT